jgi:hypothetical protein
MVRIARIDHSHFALSNQSKRVCENEEQYEYDVCSFRPSADDRMIEYGSYTQYGMVDYRYNIIIPSPIVAQHLLFVSALLGTYTIRFSIFRSNG